MLVMWRRVGERIRIGEDVIVEVVNTRRGQVRLAFQAPAGVDIHREEVHEDIQKNGRRKGREDDAYDS